jgi:E3 ubiquitin-protein ligase MYCBP2
MPNSLLPEKDIFHFHCIKTILERKWLGARITFGFAGCPICKQKVNHPMLKDFTNPIWELHEEVKESK